MPDHCPTCGAAITPPATLGGRLALLRKARGETLRGVAAATGLSNPVISQIENGKVGNPGVWTLARLAAHYGATVGELVEGLDVPEKPCE